MALFRHLMYQIEIEYERVEWQPMHRDGIKVWVSIVSGTVERKHKRRGVIFNKMLFYLISPITCSVSSLRDSLKLENTANNLKLFFQSFYLPTLLSGIGNRCEELFILFCFLSLTKFSVFTYNHFLEIQIERTQFPGGKYKSYFKRPRKPVSFGEFIW